jgi:protein-disulfide isomerase
MDKFKTDFASADVNAVVSKDLKDVKELGGSGTPTFVLNGKKIENPGTSLETLSKVLDVALAEANKN